MFEGYAPPRFAHQGVELRSERTFGPRPASTSNPTGSTGPRGRRVGCPLRVLWAAHGTVGACFDVLAAWRVAAQNVSGRAVDCGHYIAEERPAELLAEIDAFFKEE